MRCTTVVVGIFFITYDVRTVTAESSNGYQEDERVRKVFPECKGVTLDEVYADLRFERQSERPYVAINMVSSVDGRTTIGGQLQQNRIGSPVDRQLMGWVRHAADAVIRGAQTVRANPVYPAVPDGLVRIRQAKGLSEQPLAALISNSCDVPLDAALFASAPRRPIVITSHQAPEERLAPLRDVADVLVVGEETVDLAGALTKLRHEYGIDRILLEGGPSLNYQFLRQGLVDELFWTVAPKMIGGKAELSWVEGNDLFDPLVQLKLVSAYTLDDELFLRYSVL